MRVDVAERLLRWYDSGHREMPWRGSQDPYAIWVSETMLQQTRVETVIPYYQRFLSNWPTVEALAQSEEEEVLKCWEGLGYYSRARNLRQGAIQVMTEYGGCLPGTAAELTRIRGIGPYTAGAIASIAFHERTPAVDGNVIRVTCRVEGLREPLASSAQQKRVWQAAADLVPAERPGDFNQAMMDLGATICVPGTPDCDRCPLQSLCDARNTGDAAALPCLPQKKPPKPLPYTVVLICGEKGFLMRQRTEALLKGLWVFPMLEGHLMGEELVAEAQRVTGVQCAELLFIRPAKHVFTHRVWDMRIHAGEAPSGEAKPPYRWVSLAEMKTLPLPVAMKAAAETAQEIEVAFQSSIGR